MGVFVIDDVVRVVGFDVSADHYAVDVCGGNVYAVGMNTAFFLPKFRD
jgi:hypothetical protein